MKNQLRIVLINADLKFQVKLKQFSPARNKQQASCAQPNEEMVRTSPMRNRSIVFVLIALLVALTGSAHAAAEKRHADHEQLRGMLKNVAQALNSRDLDALAPLFSKKFSVVTMDQKRLTSAAEVKDYF